MVANDGRDLRVLVDVAEDPLADRRVLLHLPTLVERERTGLLEETGREPDLADVVHEPAQVRVLLHLSREPHARSDVAGVNGDCSGVAGRVLISSVEGRDERGSELEIGALERLRSP